MKDSRDENERQQTYILYMCVYIYTYVQTEKGNVFVLAQLASIAQANFFFGSFVGEGIFLLTFFIISDGHRSRFF